MKTIRLFIILTISSWQMTAQDLKVHDLVVDQVLNLDADLSEGQTIPLTWASSSQVACFPATRFNEFKGNHVFYRVDLPAQSQMTITVKPNNNKRINLYAMRMGVEDRMTPPDIQVVGACEASYPIYAGTPNYQTRAKAQSVEFMSIRNPYSILIGVAGAENVLSGSYDLNIEISSR